ncbi:MAG: hypothetical protein RLZZ347_634 [Candidatus Parcubacteria bacterium]|jgi:hypothetical protein
MFINLSGEGLGQHGFVHITGLRAVGGLQNINAPNLSQEERVIVAVPAWVGYYAINDDNNMAFLFTDDGEVWLGTVAQFTAAKNLVEALCPKGQMGGSYPLLGVMRIADLFQRMANPTCGLVVKDCEVAESQEGPGRIAVVPPPTQAKEGAGGGQSEQAA